MITEKLTNIILGTDYENLPDEVINKAKLCFTDFLGVALRGSRTTSGKAALSIVNNCGASTILGHKQSSPAEAAFVNGVFAHSLDLDDGHRFAQLHPGCSVIPAALSLTEAQNQNGKEFISSMVAGYQISILMGLISNPEHRNKGFHSTGTCGTFGAAAAACKALKLDFKNSINALGLAGTQAAGLLESDHSGTMGKHLHAGKAAQSGVISALLAQKGMTGAKSIIDGEEGFLNSMVFSHHQNEHDMIKTNEIIENQHYHILDVYFKKYPACRHLHSTIDASINIFHQMISDGVKPETIEKINIETYKIAAKHDDYSPHTFEAVKQSLPVTAVICILYGHLNLNEQLSPEIISLASKVVIEHSNDMEGLFPFRRPSKVTVSTHSNSYSCAVDLPAGEPENPLTKVDMVDKFHGLNPDIDLDILECVDNIESFKMRTLMELINEKFKTETF